jgi:hypothetical protein
MEFSGVGHKMVWDHTLTGTRGIGLGSAAALLRVLISHYCTTKKSRILTNHTFFMKVLIEMTTF